MYFKQYQSPNVLALLSLLSSSAVWADSWTLTQSVTVDSTTNIIQRGTAGNSVQAPNIINLSGTNGTLNDNSRQTMDIQNHNLELTQETSTAASIQAINSIYGHTVNGVTQTLQSNGSSSNQVKFNQVDDIGDGNSQAINRVETSNTGSVNKLTQTVNSSGHIVFFDQLGGSNNIQAANLIKAATLSTTANNVTQDYSATATNFKQENTTNSLQTANGLIMVSGGSGGTLKQDFSSTVTSFPIISFTQTSVSGSIQSMNYAGESL